MVINIFSRKIVEYFNKDISQDQSTEFATHDITNKTVPNVIKLFFQENMYTSTVIKNFHVGIVNMVWKWLKHFGRRF